MERYYVANLEWISSDKGGRKSIPREGTRYCPLIRICKDGGGVDWSIDFVCPDFSITNNIKFKFLVNNAPDNLIEENITYGLYEGNKHVAELRVVDIIE